MARRLDRVRPHARHRGERISCGFNVIRVNQRNCGRTAFDAQLYNSGLSNDMRAIVAELIAQDKLPEIFVVGFSMGGNLVLKMAGEMADSAPPELRGVIAVCPAANLAACADALNERQNIIYQRHFVRSLKKHTRFKAGLFPERYPSNGLDGVRTVREFDDAITAKFCGYRDAMIIIIGLARCELRTRFAFPQSSFPRRMIRSCRFKRYAT